MNDWSRPHSHSGRLSSSKGSPKDRSSLSRRALSSLVRALVVIMQGAVTRSGQNIVRRGLQSVLNAAARLVFSARRSDNITPLLRELHLLKVLERIQLVRGVNARGHLHSVDYMTLVVPATRCSTLGDRAFPVSAARTWNALPSLAELHRHSPRFGRNLRIAYTFLESFPDT